VLLEGFDSCSESLWLPGLDTQFSNKIEIPANNRITPGVFGGGAEALESPVAWDKETFGLGPGPDTKDLEGRGRNPNGFIRYRTYTKFSLK
jgi:hypothetical protein